MPFFLRKPLPIVGLCLLTVSVLPAADSGSKNEPAESLDIPLYTGVEDPLQEVSLCQALEEIQPGERDP